MTRRAGVCTVIALVLVSPPLALAQTSEQAAREAFGDDVHEAAGIACGSCHQGAPSSAYAPVARTAVGPLCAKCHGDAAYMRGFDPQVRTDQYAQYVTSVHGKRMSAGETRVATCIDCHGVHGIRRVRDPRSPVAPLNAAQTCGRCHSDRALMAAFNREPTPLSDWSASVHATALLKQGDTSAPTCNTCHGSHGATPPGVTQVANVCAQCHVREADLFRASPKKAIFDQIGQAECLVCHSNHRVERPADSWVGLKEPAVCTICHDQTTAGASTILDVRAGLDNLTGTIDDAERLLSRAQRAGMLVDEGQAALREAREHRIHARVFVHAFATKPFADMADQGVQAARRSHASGEQALRELQVRRRGLLAATVVILGFLVTLWFKIRQLRESDEGSM